MRRWRPPELRRVFVRFAEACGAIGFRCERPEEVRSAIEATLLADGPAICEAIVDPFEPPMPARVKAKHALNMAEALARGEPNRGRIALTLFRGNVTALPEGALFGQLIPTLPAGDWRSIISIAIPLFLVTLVSQEQADGTVPRWVEALSGRTGRSLWRYDLDPAWFTPPGGKPYAEGCKKETELRGRGAIVHSDKMEPLTCRLRSLMADARSQTDKKKMRQKSCQFSGRYPQLVDDGRANTTHRERPYYGQLKPRIKDVKNPID